MSAIAKISFVHSVMLGGMEHTHLNTKDPIVGRGKPEIRHEGAEVVLTLGTDVVRVPIANVRWYAEAPPARPPVAIAYDETARALAPESASAQPMQAVAPAKRSHKRKPSVEEPQS